MSDYIDEMRLDSIRRLQWGRYVFIGIMAFLAVNAVVMLVMDEYLFAAGAAVMALGMWWPICWFTNTINSSPERWAEIDRRKNLFKELNG